MDVVSFLVVIYCTRGLFCLASSYFETFNEGLYFLLVYQVIDFLFCFWKKAYLGTGGFRLEFTPLSSGCMQLNIKHSLPTNKTNLSDRDANLLTQFIIHEK